MRASNERWITALIVGFCAHVHRLQAALIELSNWIRSCAKSRMENAEAVLCGLAAISIRPTADSGCMANARHLLFLRIETTIVKKKKTREREYF